MKKDRFGILMLLAVVVVFGGFYLLCTQYWGKSPTIKTITRAGIGVTYYPNPFSGPPNPRFGVLLTHDPENQVDLKINVRDWHYSDSLYVNTLVDSAYSLLSSKLADSLQNYLPEKFHVFEVSAPQSYWDMRNN